MKERDVALQAAKAAHEYLMQDHDIEIAHEKANFCDYATKQDIEVERIIIEVIKKEFPDDNILAEESDSGLDKKGRIWIIDPIDGTRNFANKIPYFATNIAFFHEEVLVGVTYWHSMDEIYVAVKGKGVTLNGKKLVMNNPDQKFRNSLLTTGYAYDKKIEHDLKRFFRLYENCTDIMRFGAAAIDLCNIANGRFGGYYERNIKPWDVASGLLMVHEMGGVTSNYSGDPVDLFSMNIEIVACKNKKIYSEIIRLM